MKKIFVTIVLVHLFSATPSRADLWGGDLIYLSQILANAIQQLAQLRQIFNSGQDTLNMMKDINRGINDSLALIRTISPNSDPGLYRDWEKVQDALKMLEDIYGVAIPSGDFQVQRDTDQSIGEAITFNNSVYKYTKVIDEIGETIKLQSHNVSPGGAAKLTAQSLGVLLHVQNESLRAQATGLKLQAEALAIQNRKDKNRTKQMTESFENLATAMDSQHSNFTLPRF